MLEEEETEEKREKKKEKKRTGPFRGSRKGFNLVYNGKVEKKKRA